jgi:hypothetical protein
MSETPRTDGRLLTISPANGIYPTAFYKKGGYTERPNGVVDADEMRQLERELSAANAELQRLRSALHWCYEKLQPLQPFEDWVKEIGRS